LNNKQYYLTTFKRFFYASLIQIVMILIITGIFAHYILASMFYTSVLLFASLAITLLVGAKTLACPKNDPSISGIFNYSYIIDVIPGYILTFSTQIIAAHVALACGFPLIASALAFIAVLIGVPISALLCASINKCVHLYTGNNDIEVIHEPYKKTFDYYHSVLTFYNFDEQIPTFKRNSDTSITIPPHITGIIDYAFLGCINLTSINIPDSVTEIGTGAFRRCRSLASITIPSSVTYIGEGAFKECTSLTSITIPNSVTEIGDSAFSLCSSLTSITIPDSVTKIGEGAFCDCESLTSITIPNSVTKIGAFAFSLCTSLTSITIHDGVTRIGSNAFAYCTSLTSITIPNSVTEIGYCVFNGCTNLDVIICSDPDQFDRDNLYIDRTRTQVISYQEYLTNNHADLLTATNLTDLNSNEAYLIYRLISEPEFNPSWQVLETTFNERSLPQIRRLLQNIGKDTDHLPRQIIFFRGEKIPPHIEEFLSIADRSSLFGQAQRTIDISFVKQQQVASSQQTPAAQ
jgi:hypothetical protein